MKKMIMLFSLFLSSMAMADCQNTFIDGQKELCYEYQWVSGPHLNGGHGHHGHQMKRPAKPLASSVRVLFWKKSDIDQNPVQVEGLRIYPWMIMDNGMEHGTRPETLRFQEGYYYVEGIYLMKMMGYWEMRLTIPADYNDFNPEFDYVSSFRID